MLLFKRGTNYFSTPCKRFPTDELTVFVFTRSPLCSTTRSLARATNILSDVERPLLTALHQLKAMSGKGWLNTRRCERSHGRERLAEHNGCRLCACSLCVLSFSFLDPQYVLESGSNHLRIFPFQNFLFLVLAVFPSVLLRCQFVQFCSPFQGV